MRDFFYCLIFPHPLNNHRARVLHPKILLLFISFFIFSSLFFSSNLNPWGTRIKAFAEVSVQELLNLTNQKRAENGLSQLILSQQLSSAAGKKAEDMFAKNYWAHNSPNGTTPWVFIIDSGYSYVYAGENLARGFKESDDIVDAWMASETHRANILSPRYKDIGFAIKSGILNGEETILVVQEFGSRSVLSGVNEVPKNTELGSETNNVSGISLYGNLTKLPTLSTSSQIVIFVIAAFIGVFILDLIYIKRKKIIRFTGHNVDHVIFLGIVIFIIAIFNTGTIL